MGRKPPPYSLKDPDSDWESSPGDNIKKVLDKGNDLLEQIENAPEEVADKAGTFFESVTVSLKSMLETIEQTQRVSDRQQTALTNWENAVGRWFHD